MLNVFNAPTVRFHLQLSEIHHVCFLHGPFMIKFDLLVSFCFLIRFDCLHGDLCLTHFVGNEAKRLVRFSSYIVVDWVVNSGCK